MTDPELTPEQTPEAQPAEDLVPRAELEAALAQLAEAQARAADHLDGWQRALADCDNYRKRVERDRAADALYARGEMIKRILPVLDDLERALANRPAGGGEAAWVGGIELIQRKLQTVLENEGIQRIPAEGEAFDPRFHEAVTHEDSPGHESGRIVAVIQQGYMLGERVLRPALVRVAR